MAGQQPRPDGVLSGSEIVARIQNGTLAITPILEWPTENSGGQFGLGSIDVRLGNWFAVPHEASLAAIDPTGYLGDSGEAQSRDFNALSKYDHTRPFVLHPNRFALAYTLEYFRLPSDLMGYVIGRSSWGRLGLIIATATMINPNFRGVITLELANLGNAPVVLYPGMRIAQVVFHPLAQESTDELSTVDLLTPHDKYEGQLPGAPQRLFKDRDIPWIAPITAEVVIGIAGTTSSGKSILTSLLIERGYSHFSLSDIIRDFADQRGIERDTASLQDLGDMLRKRFGNRFLALETYRRIRNEGRLRERIVITGFKHPDEVRVFQSDDRFRLVGILANYATCLTRYKKERESECTEQEITLFEKEWRRDYCSDIPHGQCVRDCLELAGPRWSIKNDGISLSDFKSEAKRLFDLKEQGS